MNSLLDKWLAWVYHTDNEKRCNTNEHHRMCNGMEVIIMETMEIVVWSDNDEIECVANIIHDRGYRTAEIRKESLGAYENSCNWSFCKLNMVDSICVDVNGYMGKIVTIEHVEEQPMFRYVATFIISDSDDDTECTECDDTECTECDDTECTECDDTENAVMNIGCTTKNGVNMDVESMMNKIGSETDCTITRCVGFYKGKREDSLRVDIYDTRADIAVSMASYFAHIFMQECVAVTIGDKTVFVTDDYTDTEFVEWCDALEK